MMATKDGSLYLDEVFNVHVGIAKHGLDIVERILALCLRVGAKLTRRVHA